MKNNIKIKIIGHGAWGSSLYSVLKTNCSSVSFWDRKQIINEADVVVLSLPTQSIRSVLRFIKFRNTKKIIINTAKGIEKLTHKFPYQIVAEELGDEFNYFSLIGPSFAGEVKQKMPTIINLGYKKDLYKNEVKSCFQTEFMKVRLTKAIEVLELFAAFKNIYAVACGLAEGLGFGVNTRVKIIMVGLEELNTLSKSLNLRIDSDVLPGTLGDLILTCSSRESRNYRFGGMLTKYSVDEALKKINETVEGYYTIDSISYFARKNKIKLPLAKFVSNVIADNNYNNIKKHFYNFLNQI